MENLDFNQMVSETESDIVLVFNDPSKAEDALKRAKENKKLLTENYDRSQRSEIRKKAFDLVNDLIKACTDQMGAEFPVGSTPDAQAALKIMSVRKSIQRMSIDQASEAEARKAITSLCVNDGRSYFEANHEEMQKLWKQYYEKSAANYLAYAQAQVGRSPERDRAILNKVRDNMHKYKPELAQAILNLLEPKTPTESNGTDQ